MSTRWPVHPAPAPGEALTSWLRRIADRYGITVEDLAFDIGFILARHEDLDIAPPAGFIDQLASRTGLKVDRIHTMTISGNTPWLLDQIEPGAEAYTTYTRQLAVLLPRGRRRDRTVEDWRAWVPTVAGWSHRACPRCTMESTPPCPYQLAWLVPLMLSCPVHYCRIELHDGPLGYHDFWHTSPGGPEPRPVGEAIRSMDQRTWRALTTGAVELPRHRVHAGTWFRLLRTLLDELGTPLVECGAAGRLTREVWQRTGHRFRAGQSVWRPYEELTPDKQRDTLEAAATAMSAMESGTLIGRGDGAGLFLPETDVSIDPGRPRQEVATSVVLWQKAMDSLHAVVEEARHDPDSARRFFDLMTAYRRDDDKVLQRVRNDFTELGIPSTSCHIR